MKGNDEITLREVFSHFNLADDDDNIKVKTYNMARRRGYKVVGDFRGKNFFDLLGTMKNASYAMVIICMIAVENYGVKVEIPSLEQTADSRTIRAIAKANDTLKKYKSKIEFV